MKTEEAIKTIQGQINQISHLKQYCRFESKETSKWLFDTYYCLEDIFGGNSEITKAFKNVSYEHEGNYEYEKGGHDAKLRWLNLLAYQKGLDITQGLLESAIGLLKRKGIDSVFEGRDTPKEASEILRIVSLIENSLRKAIRNMPTTEKEIQDSLEILFIGAGLDFTREKERFMFSSKTYQPDFVFNRIGTVVEVKFCGREEREREIIGEINDYIVAFQTKYPNLIFVVYDKGFIRDEDGFKGSFEQKKSVIVKVVKQ